MKFLIKIVSGHGMVGHSAGLCFNSFRPSAITVENFVAILDLHPNTLRYLNWISIEKYVCILFTTHWRVTMKTQCHRLDIKFTLIIHTFYRWCERALLTHGIHHHLQSNIYFERISSASDHAIYFNFNWFFCCCCCYFLLSYIVRMEVEKQTLPIRVLCRRKYWCVIIICITSIFSWFYLYCHKLLDSTSFSHKYCIWCMFWGNLPINFLIAIYWLACKFKNHVEFNRFFIVSTFHGSVHRFNSLTLSKN